MRAKNIAICLLSIYFLVNFCKICHAQPIGAVTQIEKNIVSGWAYDPNTPAQPIRVDFYIDAPWNKYRGENKVPDHFAGYASTNAQGKFSFFIPQNIRSRVGPGRHSLYVYAIAAGGKGPNSLIQISNFFVRGIKKAVDPWFNNFSSDCKAWKDKKWKYGENLSYSFSSFWDCSDEYGSSLPPGDKFWVLESTNELYNFTPLYDTPNTTFSFYPDAKLWNFGFTKKKNGGHTIGWVIDKLNFEQFGTKKDTYSGAFFERELQRYKVNLAHKEIFIEFDVRINASEQGVLTNDSSTLDYFGAKSRNMLLARNRATIGLVGKKDGITRIVEVNMFKTQNFDLCTKGNLVEHTNIPCEAHSTADGIDGTLDVFDRRSDFGSGQLVYYNLEQIHRVFGPKQQNAASGGNWQRVRIPVTSLFRNSPWTDAKNLLAKNGLIDLNGFIFDAFYVGHEVWGRGRLWADFDNFEIYSFIASE